MMNRLNPSNNSFQYRVVPVSMMQKSPMEKSGTYAACEQMMHMPCMKMQLSKLNEMLDRLEKHGRLTIQEHQGLLELARQIWHGIS
jgi:hypothetical protein